MPNRNHFIHKKWLLKRRLLIDKGFFGYDTEFALHSFPVAGEILSPKTQTMEVIR
jgi:hypothetical protein